MKKLAIVIALFMLVGCDDKPTGPYAKGDIPVWAGGYTDVTPDFCELLKSAYPDLQCMSQTHFGREIEVDGQIVIDEFDILEGPPSERELASEIISPSAAGNYYMDMPNPQCNPDWLSCWVVVVWNGWEDPTHFHYELKCIANGCLPAPR